MGCVTRVKICGITHLEDAHFAVDEGAWAVGLIFAPESKRQVDVSEAELIGRQLARKVEVVGVFVNAPLDELVEIADVARLTMLQLHGDEGPAYAREAARRTGARVIKAIPARDAAEIRRLTSFRTDFHLLDAYVPGQRGGTGKTFQWDYTRHHTRHVPLILSGGLTPDNVAAAIEATHPYAVDSASGTEASPGVKDPDKVVALLRAVQQEDAKNAPPEPEPVPDVEPEPAPTEAA